MASVTRGHSYTMLTHLLLQVSAARYHAGRKKKKKASQEILSLLLREKAPELESLDGGEYMIETRKERRTKLITGSNLGVFKTNKESCHTVTDHRRQSLPFQQ